jgi:hypothetical protein
MVGLAAGVLCVFVVDLLAFALIRRPAASRLCCKCRYRSEGPVGLPVCTIASRQQKNWDPMTGLDVISVRPVACASERRGGIVNALALALVQQRRPACSRYGFNFTKNEATDS